MRIRLLVFLATVVPAVASAQEGSHLIFTR